jgi:hypothetical protein
VVDRVDMVRHAWFQLPPAPSDVAEAALAVRSRIETKEWRKHAIKPTMDKAQWQRRWRRWIGLTAQERWLLWEAACTLALARGAVLTIPFRTIAARLGMTHTKAHRDLSASQEALAQQISWSVRALARYTPWDSNCLAQAIAARFMLRRRGIPCTLFLGVAKATFQPARLEAHAWVTCGNTVLTGAPGHERFTVIATYGDST